MNKKINLLVIEDSEDDAYLVKRQLEHAGYVLDFKRVDNAEDLTESLSEREWDMIICDFVMPSFTGLDAYRILKQTGKDIPFIIISGKIGEETAVEAMRTGVQDYMMKGNTARLIPAVERELKEAVMRKKHKEAEKKLKQREQEFKALVEHAPDIISRYDKNSRILYINPAVEREFSIPPENFIGKTFSEAGIEGNTEYLEEKIKSVFIIRAEQTAELGFRVRDEIAWYFTRLVPEIGADGTVESVLAISYNITERKEIEEELRRFRDHLKELVEARTAELKLINNNYLFEIEERKRIEEVLRQREEQYRALVENSHDLISRVDKGSRIIYVNPVIEKITGMPPDKYLGKTVAESGYPSNVSEDWKAHLVKVFSSKKPSRGEWEMAGLKGVCHYDWILIPEFNPQGEVETVLSVSRDITKRKLAEEALRLSEERYRIVSELITDIAFSFSVGNGNRLKTEWATGAFEQITGYSPDDPAIRDKWHPLIHNEDIEKSQKNLKKLLSGKPVTEEYRIVDKTGDIHWLRTYSRPVWSKKAQRVIRIYGASEDITSSKLAEIALMESEREYRELVESANSVIIRWAPPDGELTFANDYALSFFGYKKDELIGKPVSILLPESDSAGRNLKDIPREISQHIEDYRNNENENITSTGERVWVAWSNRAIKNEKGEIVEILAIGNDVSRLKKAERDLEKFSANLEIANKKLSDMSRFDEVTGVPNRRFFNEVLDREWHRAAREKTPLSLLMVDIDFFKPYNDTYGHIKGDSCLKQVAKAIDNTIKRYGDFVARYGGEEFSVILVDTEEPGAYKIAEEIRQSVWNLHIVHSTSVISDRVTISIGVSSIRPDPSENPRVLIRAADEALYDAKKTGRNKVVAKSTIPA